MFRCPWLGECLLEVFRSRNPLSNQVSSGLWKGLEVERLPLRGHFGPVVLRHPGLEVVAVAQSVTDLPEHEDSGLLREVDLLDDRSSCSVRHFALIPVGPKYSTVDVSPTKRSRDVLSSHVLPSQSPCYAPSSPDRPE